ncbi:plasmid mobilization protein [Schaalia odontolytica]|uniref:plasmid mobilization protein n=1 Tax=Schaalia odontolytica TaxID=1660 RepID=UPI0036F19A04
MMNVVVNARGVSKGGGTPPFGQHGLSSDRPSAGRQAVPPLKLDSDETSVKSTPVQPEVTTTNEVEDQVRGGDRRIARRKSRESRVTVRFSEREAAQLTRVANRYGLSESGAIRAAVDYLDGAPEPKLVNRDLLRLNGEVNAVGVNVNQIARQGWAGVEPDVNDLRCVTAELLAIAKELSA